MTQYLFIDGHFFELRFSALLKHLFPNENPFTAIDFSKLTQNYDRAFYYDALPAKKPAESETDWRSRHDDKKELFNSLNMKPKVHVRLGTSRYRKKRGLEQKGVDILLAIEALLHATSGIIDNSSFILSDLDFCPLLGALVQTRVKSHLYYDPHKTSKELIYAADISLALNAGTLDGWLRDDLRKQTGFSHQPGPFLEALIDEQTAKCGGRTVVIGKHCTSDYYVARYEDSTKYCTGKIPYMLLSSFEDAPGRKVTGAERFGFP
jgi:uncharacterized LabA/DUF88 family protein